MTDSPNNPSPADRKSANGVAHSAGRRRWLQAGISAAPVIMTVASRPVLAVTNPPGFCRAPSGFVSGNASGAPVSSCLGVTPGYWKNHTDSWPSLFKTTDKFKTMFSPDTQPVTGLTLLCVLEPGCGGAPSGPPYDVARHIVSALLNNASGRVLETTLPLATIKAMWTQYANGVGSYSVNATVSWNGDQIVTYLLSTMD